MKDILIVLLLVTGIFVFGCTTSPGQNATTSPPETGGQVAPPETGGQGGQVQPVSSVLFSDDFESAAYTNRSWNQTPGKKWKVEKGEFTLSDVGEGMRMAGVKVSAKSYVVDVDFKNPTDGGIIVRGEYDRGDYTFGGMTYVYKPRIFSYGIQYPGESYWIGKLGSGWTGMLAKAPEGTLDEGVNVHLTVIVNGNTYKAYVNGEESVSYVDNESRYDGEWVLVYLYRPNQSFDNFRITVYDPSKGEPELQPPLPGGQRIPFSDNFDNEAFSNSTWKQAPANRWRVEEGEYTVNDTVEGMRMIGAKFNAKNYAVEVDFKHPEDGGILVRGEYKPEYGEFDGLTFVYKPRIISYGVAYPGVSYCIGKAPGLYGGWTGELARSEKGTLHEGTDVHLKVMVDGNEFKAYVNGEEWLSYTDTKNEYSGKWVGIYLFRPNQSFDNFKITPVT